MGMREGEGEGEKAIGREVIVVYHFSVENGREVIFNN